MQSPCSSALFYLETLSSCLPLECLSDDLCEEEYQLQSERTGEMTLSRSGRRGGRVPQIHAERISVEGPCDDVDIVPGRVVGIGILQDKLETYDASN
jgi:hypothetical protein